MTPRSITPPLLALVWPAGCQCTEADDVAEEADADTAELDTEASSGSSGSGSTSNQSTNEPFDASRWIGRYHFEHVFSTFGDPGESHGSYSLTNFEILSDARATMVYDHCSFEEPITIEYEWLPSDDGWLVLQPGAGETSLRFMANPDVETLRVQLIEPCRELELEVDGSAPSFYVVRPGASCWVDKCTTGSIMHIDYCDGEEPEDACP